MEKYQKIIEKYNIPGRDLYELPDSPLRFPDGAHYRNEIAGIANPQEMEALLKEVELRKVPIHRIIAMECGTNIFTFSEIKDIAQMARDAKIELIVIPTPRANTDIGKHAISEWGRYSGVRVRGSDMICYLLQEVVRCIEAGIRGFLFYGEEVLSLFDQMRKNGDLPSGLLFKLSYTAGVSNPAGCVLAEQVGADSINPITDLTLPMLAAMRKVSKLSLDIVTIDAGALGSLNRFWECSEIIRVACPVYLKQEMLGSVENARLTVKYSEIVNELISGQNPNLVISKQGVEDLKIPKP